jgi:cytochrome d ubiquinol oxidase subunit I
MRMELDSLRDVIFNPVAQSKFVHTVSAGYVTGAIFVLAISAWYLLKGRHIEIAKRSATVALSFGLAASLSVVVLGDESGYTLTQNQKMKIAAIESEWHTAPAPAAFTAFGIPDSASHTTRDRVQVPWMLGLIATRSTDQEVPGIFELVERAKVRIANGIPAYTALRALRRDARNEEARQILVAHAADLGYALLLRKYVDDPAQATPEQIDHAAWDTVPAVGPMFWTFRVMVALGLFFIGLFVVGFVLAARRRLLNSRVFLRVAFWALPLPWVAAELGWVVAEYGRQPWAIAGVLPTFLAVSPIPVANVALSLTGFVVFYSLLAIMDVYLLRKYIRRGPEAVPTHDPGSLPSGALVG